MSVSPLHWNRGEEKGRASHAGRERPFARHAAAPAGPAPATGRFVRPVPDHRGARVLEAGNAGRGGVSPEAVGSAVGIPPGRRGTEEPPG
ncbi:hypothetical protein ABGT92_10255, partial [Streptomyces cinereoruber]